VEKGVDSIRVYDEDGTLIREDNGINDFSGYALDGGGFSVALRGCFQKGIFVAWQGKGMVCVNQTRPHYINQMGKTQSKPLAERHGRGTAWYV
jgi:hypothetical protein